MSKQELTAVIYTENSIGLLNKVTTMFSRRRINIESLNVAPSEVDGIHRLTIVVFESEEVIKKLMLQIEKQIDVFKTFYYTNEEIVWQDHILFKIAIDESSNLEIENLCKYYGARHVTAGESYVIYETTGSAETSDAIVKSLETIGITEMVRGARIAVAKYKHSFKQELREMICLP